jgi:transposase InsO family protein
MRLRLVDAAKKNFPVARLCKALDIRFSSYSAWKNRPASTRMRDDLVSLAHVRSAFTLSYEPYGRSRVTHVLRERGLAAGRRRLARLRRENRLSARKLRYFQRMTDSGHAFPVTPNYRDQIFTATGPERKWGADISSVWTREGCL